MSEVSTVLQYSTVDPSSSLSIQSIVPVPEMFFNFISPHILDLITPYHTTPTVMKHVMTEAELGQSQQIVKHNLRF